MKSFNSQEISNYMLTNYALSTILHLGTVKINVSDPQRAHGLVNDKQEKCKRER